MPGNRDPRGIDPQPGGIGRIAQEGKHGAGVLGVLGKAERTRAAPRSAIVEGHRVPSGAAHRLGEVEVLLVARPAMADHQRRMRPRPGGEIGDAVDLHPAAGNVQHLHPRGMCLVRSRIGVDRGRVRRRAGGKRRSGGKRCGKGKDDGGVAHDVFPRFGTC
jgi:hypothetical protein